MKAQIDLADTLVPIDALGCPKDIIKQTVTGGGDCVIAVKDNQPKLLGAIEELFAEHLERDMEDLRYRCHETREEGDGRIDERSYFLTKVPREFAAAKDWAVGEGDRLRRAHHRSSRRSSTRARVVESKPTGMRRHRPRSTTSSRGGGGESGCRWALIGAGSGRT